MPAMSTPTPRALREAGWAAMAAVARREKAAARAKRRMGVQSLAVSATGGAPRTIPGTVIVQSHTCRRAGMSFVETARSINEWRSRPHRGYVRRDDQPAFPPH